MTVIAYITHDDLALWLGIRVFSVPDSGAKGLGSNRSRDAVG